MSDKITTLKLVDNTDVFPNIKDENIPNTIMRVTDLSKYLNQLKSINISTLNVSGASQFEGEATFGHNVHVDGNLVVNGIDNIVDKGGNKIVNTGTFDPASDSPAGQKSLTDFIIETDLNSRWSRIGSYNFYGGFTHLPAFYSGKFKLIRDTPFNAPRDYVLINLFAYCDVREIDYNASIANFFRSVKSIDLEQGFIFCSSLEVISAEYDLSKVNNLKLCFYGCTSLKTIKLKNFPISFDISASTAFEESDLVEIIGNLVDLTGKTSQTLTMGATNLAKLTDAEKAVAVNKNWVLA